jgi:hypothetical protein
MLLFRLVNATHVSLYIYLISKRLWRTWKTNRITPAYLTCGNQVLKYRDRGLIELNFLHHKLMFVTNCWMYSTLPVGWLAVTKTSSDCPGERTTRVVLNGFTYSPSVATTVIVWFAIWKKWLLFNAAFMSCSKYVFPETTSSLA